MNLTPSANTGNYFSTQDREARRGEWMETFSLKPIRGNALFRGDHNFKFGSIITRTSNRGEFRARPVNILDNQGTLLRRNESTDGSSFHSLHDAPPRLH